MAIFLRHSYNIPPVRWGSFADVQYAIKKNSETVYGIDPDTNRLLAPYFWGFPLIDYSANEDLPVNNGGLYKNRGLFFDGSAELEYTDIDINNFTLRAIIRPSVLGTNLTIAGDIDPTEGGNFSFLYKKIDTDKYRISIKTSSGFYNAYSTTSAAAGKSVIVIATFDSSISRLRLFYEGSREDNVSTVGTLLQNDFKTKIGYYSIAAPQQFNGSMYEFAINTSVFTTDQIAKFSDLPYGLYQKVTRPFYLLPIEAEATKFYDLNTEILGGSESLQDLTTSIRADAETFFDLNTEISATAIQTIADLNTEIAAAFNISFEDLNTDIQTIAESLTDLNTEITAGSDFVFHDLSSEIEVSALGLYDLNTEVITKAQIVSDLNTDIQARGDTFYDLNTDIQIRNGAVFYDLTTKISVIRSKYWLDTEIEALSYARWSFNTKWNPNRFLNTEIAAKKPYTFSFKTKTGSSYVASSSEIEILLSGYSWPLRTLFLDYLRVGTSNTYNFELWWSRGQSGKNPLKNAKIKAEYTNTSHAGGYEVVSCDWLSASINGGAEQTINATPLDLGDMPCDSKLDIELTVDCRDCSLTRGLVFFRLIVTGDYKEAIYGAPIVYGDGTQYFSGDCDDYTSNNFIARLYVVG